MTVPKGEPIEVTIARRRARYEANREKILARAKDYYAETKETRRDARRAIAAADYRKHKARRDAQRIAWKKANPDKALAYSRISTARNLATEHGRMRNRIKARVWRLLKGQKANASTESLVGWTYAELRDHITRQFTKGMSWDRVMSGEIHIDHIVPLSSFTITGPDDPELRRAWALTNLRPLWSAENHAKSNKREFLL